MTASVTNTVKVTGNAVTTLTTATITSAASGSTFVVAVSHAASTTPNTPTDNKGNTYTIRGTTQSNAGVGAATWFVCENGAGGSGHTFTQTFAAAADPAVLVLELAGVASASFDAGSRAQAADNSSPYTVTSGTLAQADSIVLAFLGGGDSPSNPATIAESTGFTIAVQELNASLFWAGAVAYKVVSATTALTPSFTETGVVNGVSLHIAAFKATAGPIISVQPTEQTSSSGSTATFNVTATTSGGTLTYQWQELISDTWTNISSATSSGYTTGTLASSDNGRRFRVQVSDDNGTRNSAEVYLFLTGLASAGKGREHTAWISGRTRKAGSSSGLKFLKLRSVARNTPSKDNKDFIVAWNTWYFPVVAANGSTGTLARTNANDTSTASGTTTVLSTLARTNANDISSASGSPVASGSSSTTNVNDTLAASGSVGGSVTGTLATTNANDTSSGTGTTTILSTLARTNANDTSAASGTPVGVGSLARTNANDTSSASGTSTVPGSSSTTNNNDTLAASGSAGSVPNGTLIYTNINDTSSAAGTTTTVGTFARTNNNDTLAASGSTGGGGGSVTTRLPLTGAGNS